MSALEVVAKPEFGKTELEWLTQLREKRAHSWGPPSFTLVFPGAESADEVVKHVSETCAVTSRIRFCLRSAMIVPEAQMGLYHVFLVPDEGFGAIIRLHDRLHTGPLACCLRPDTPYIPHLTVASTQEYKAARRTVAELNAKDLAIAGRIDEVEVHERDSAEPRCVAKVPLKHGFFH
jgi:2'-5' RNA ligase